MRCAPSTDSLVEVRLHAKVARAHGTRRLHALHLGPTIGRPDVREHDGRVEVEALDTHAAVTLSRRASALGSARRREEQQARIDEALGVPLDSTSIAGVVHLLASLDVEHLDDAGLLARLRLADRVSSWAQATASAALADYATPLDAAAEQHEPQAAVRRDRHLRLEVRIARGISDDASGRDIESARRLSAELSPVRDAWSSGDLSFRHVAAFLDRTSGHEGATITALLDELGDRMRTTPAHRVGTVVSGVLARLDPAGQAARARTARRHDVGVSYRGLPDGLAQVIATHRVEDARALIERIDSVADDLLRHRDQCAACAESLPGEIGPARAAAHYALTIRDESDQRSNDRAADGSSRDAETSATSTSTIATSGAATTGRVARGRRRRPVGSRRGELQVVVDLATLLGLAEEPGLLAGTPVPAAIARELAAECGSMRRIVTDPMTGALLDYGTRTYLPDALRAFVAARDGTCTSPGCGQPAARSQLDHVVPFPHGPSNPDNTHMLCKRDHDTKTCGDMDVRRHADGSTTWTTRHGQRGCTPPRPYLPETGTPAGSLPVKPDDISDCPF
jgi:hypothetical protein